VTGKSAFDPSLLDLFRAELEVHLPALGEGLLALEKDPNQPKRLEALMRAAHSIKGAAKIVGVEAAVQLAHVLEDCFVAAQDGRVRLTSDAIDVLLRGVDALNRLTPGSDDEDGRPADVRRRLIEEIGAVRAGRAPARPAPVVAVVEAGPPTIRPAGDLVAAEAEAVRARLATLLREGVPEIRFDFAAVHDVDPAGLLVLTLAAREASRRRPPTVFQAANVAPPLRTLLRLTRLDHVFAVAGGGR
jgi:chemotaxis protein histidine kinase CheA